jgi:hypothetical protein
MLSIIELVRHRDNVTVVRVSRKTPGGSLKLSKRQERPAGDLRFSKASTPPTEVVRAPFTSAVPALPTTRAFSHVR